MGLGGMVLSGVGIWHGWAYGKPYVQKLKTATDAAAQQPSVDATTFAYVSGTLASEAPIERGGGQKFVAVWEQLYEMSVIRKVWQHGDNNNKPTRRAEYAPHNLLLSSRLVRHSSITIGQFDVSEFMDAFAVCDVEEKFAATPKQHGSDKSVTNNINVGSKGQEPQPLGEGDRQVSGIRTVTKGISLGDYYTIFGYTYSEGPARRIMPCFEYGMLVFRNQSAAQVIAEAEQSLASRDWTWRMIGCVSAVSALVGYALKD